MTRTEYREKVAASLQRMNDRITELESKIDKADVEGKSTFQKLLAEVKAKRDVVRSKVRQVGSATDSAWDELKNGLDGAWTELESSYQRARSEFTRASSPG